ncbi:uncharacterized protein DNG_06467 [Cephalotrichum gorgonifer]|uniref:Uncharacterized protein n=1 Tax=Cephalotrichum gorgonifer TaxID=2041049 RepID=A0AAE8N1M5_9PEZI|nr:uncharacterized protein DNG_06467 [Cephalotrichum gorgonifer]
MGHALSSTAFVGPGTQTSDESYPSCHILGDPELYGLGIRIAFYIQYLAFALALVTNTTASLPALRTGIAILCAALFASLCTSSTGDGLVVLDWYIVTALAAPYIFLTDLPVHAASARAYLTRRGATCASAGKLIGEHVTGGAMVRQWGILDAAISTYRAHYALSDALDQGSPMDDELTRLQHSLVEFGRVTRVSPSSDVAAPYSVREVARATTASPRDAYPFSKSRFRGDLVQACCAAGMTRSEARRAARRIEDATRRESSVARSRETLLEIREGMCVTGPRDMVAVAVVCASWAAFQVVRPWLYFRGLERGMKDGCDVRLMWFVVPASIYGETFGIWMKVWGCIMCAAGAVVFSYGAVVFVRNMVAVGRWDQGSRSLLSDVESQRRSLLSASEASSIDGSSLQSTLRSGYRQGRSPGRRRRTYFRFVAALQLFVLAVAAAMAEGTILANHIDMARFDLGKSSQVFALVVGIVTSAPVYWECLVIVPLRRSVRRKQSRDDGVSREWKFKIEEVHMKEEGKPARSTRRMSTNF